MSENEARIMLDSRERLQLPPLAMVHRARSWLKETVSQLCWATATTATTVGATSPATLRSKRCRLPKRLRAFWR